MLIGSADYAALAQRNIVPLWFLLLYPDPTPPAFQDQAEKLTNQGQAKLRDQHHPHILVIPVAGLQDRPNSPDSLCAPWAAGINPGFPACEAALLPQSKILPQTGHL